jgi:hypothetical protein
MVILIFNSSIWHWGFVGYLARELEAEVVVVPYPLAPTNNAMEVMPVLTQVYKAFLARAVGREPIIAGDRYVHVDVFTSQIHAP